MNKHVRVRATIGMCSLALSTLLLLFGCATMGSPGGTPQQAGFSGTPGSGSGGGAIGFGEPVGVVQREFASVSASQGDVIIGTRETDYTFDSQDRVTTRYHLIYKVMTGAGVDGWSSVNTGWEPWHELRPTIQARVIAPDGSVQSFDPSTEVEGSADNPSQQIFSNARTLRAPLPNVQVGSIVDETITIRESKAGDPGGAYEYFSLQDNVPVLHDRLVVDLPDSLPFHYLVTLAPGLKPVVTHHSGRVRYVFAEHNVPAQSKAEIFLPRTAPHWPHVSLSTGRSWNSVAVAYNRYVEASIQSADFSKEAAKLRGKDLKSSVENIMAWMNSRIRYTGLYEGNHSIIPTNPREVLARGYGDCKDKAVILASILRAMGWHADLALLWADGVLDAESQLPSLGQFNHAIVYVPGKDPVWVDATEVYAKPDVLPLMDQGRHALIIAPSTTHLVQLPVRPAKKNIITDTREFAMTDYGYTNVNETITYTGSAGEQARMDDDGVSQTRLKKSWNQYINNSYRFGKLVSFSNSDPRNVSKRFEERIKIDGAGRAFTDKGIAQAALPVAVFATWLPNDLSSGSTKPRKGDFIFTEPLTYTLHYIIHPPAGFSAEPLPQGGVTKLGTMTFTTRYSLRKDGTVDAYLTLDTGKTLLTPKEFEATRTAFTNFVNNDSTILSFDLDANLMIANGKYRDAFKELRRLVALDPHKPIQHLRYADALLSVGLQGAAGKQARIAISENTKNADSYFTLGQILEHDVAGRLYGPSFDRAGAIAAFKKAVTIDSSNNQYRIQLARLYEVNADGLRYGPGSQVTKAISLYEQMKGSSSWSQVKTDYWNALVRAGDWTTLRQVAGNLSKPVDKDYYLILCDTFQKGVGAALTRASRIYPDTTRRRALSRAADTLFRMRRYSDSYALLRRAVAGVPEKQTTKNLLKVLAKAKRNETIRFDLSNPKQATKQYIAAMMTATSGHLAGVKAITTPTFFGILSALDTSNSIGAQIAMIRGETLSSEVSRSVLADLTLPAVDVTSKGSRSVGYEVNGKLNVSGTGISPGLGSLYLVEEGGGLKVAADGDIPSTIGAQVLEFLAQGNRTAANQWLDWASAGSGKNGKATDPLSTPAFLEFWRPGMKNARLAAAMLLATGSGKYAREAYTILVDARSAQHGTARARVDQTLVWASWQIAGERSRALQYAAELYRTYPSSRIAFLAYDRSLQFAGEFPTAQSEAESWLKKHPDGVDPLELLVDNRPDLIRRAQVDSIMQRRINANSATWKDYNQMAWFALFFPPVSRTALDYAQQAVTLAGSGDGGVANTLAAVYAARGNVGAAYNEFLRELELSVHLNPQPEDWYILGLIAEQCGLPDAAATYFHRVTNTGQTGNDPLSPYVLAQRRLAVLR